MSPLRIPALCEYEPFSTLFTSTVSVTSQKAVFCHKKREGDKKSSFPFFMMPHFPSAPLCGGPFVYAFASAGFE